MELHCLHFTMKATVRDVGCQAALVRWRCNIAHFLDKCIYPPNPSPTPPSLSIFIMKNIVAKAQKASSQDSCKALIRKKLGSEQQTG